MLWHCFLTDVSDVFVQVPTGSIHCGTYVLYARLLLQLDEPRHANEAKQLLARVSDCPAGSVTPTTIQEAAGLLHIIP